MQRTRLRTLVIVALLATAASWAVVGLLEDSGVFLAGVPWAVDVTLVVLAGAVLWAGWTVRSYLRGRRPSLSGVRAARTLVLAKSAALAGVLLFGWYAGQAVRFAAELGVDARREKAVAALVAAVCALLLTAAGLVAESFCRLPPDDGDDAAGRTRRPGFDDGEDDEAGARA
ncbi:DUF3180 domain-containing protein [Sediminihabitans luteus]|uniref:DUF3180 domain-containing protein n=1 Tax=Sediminihabitans luteus TaxID=1138585 RepID=UPI000C24C449|nr:DUF3180 domain-containing protein [Sediminihabitans luteus]